MKMLLIRSAVIPVLLGPVLAIALHFPVKAFKVDPPLDPLKAETMSMAEAARGGDGNAGCQARGTLALFSHVE